MRKIITSTYATLDGYIDDPRGGKPRFREASAGTVELLDTTTFATGTVVHTYRPTPAAARPAA